MATILACGTCGNLMTFRDIAPKIMGEFEKVVSCTKCGTQYAILIRMTAGPTLHDKHVDVIRNKTS